MNTKQLLYIISVLLIFSVIIGCEEEDETPTSPGPSEYLYSIAMSDQWVYVREAYDNNELLYRNTDTAVIDSELVWGGSYWYGFQGADSVFWRNGVDGVWRLCFNQSHPMGIAEQYYAYPADAGDMWYVESEDDSISVVSTTESIEVPAGMFDGCYYYRIRRIDESRRQWVWIKPGVGIVQDSSMQIVNDDTLKSVMRLKQL
ncbi:MAG: hypothetical protein P9X24_09000 [Candidatus Hatepunaea meridiana]|nr:hypothetical protein [Candidatus Hatepunaea meridiana]